MEYEVFFYRDGQIYMVAATRNKPTRLLHGMHLIEQDSWKDPLVSPGSSHGFALVSISVRVCSGDGKVYLRQRFIFHCLSYRAQHKGKEHEGKGKAGQLGARST